MKSSKKLAIAGLLAALICVAAPFSISVGVIPITFATLAIYIVAAVYDYRAGVIAVLIYILLGACGVPVFSGFKAGAQVLAGATGGYIVGYVFLALIEGVIIDKFEDKKFVYPLAMVLGTAVLYAFGTAWFIVIMKTTFVAALLTCVVPFLVGDALKVAAATAISLPLRAAVKKVAVSRV